MIIFRDASPFPLAARGAVWALGNFDGLHAGHRAVIARALSMARASGRRVGVVTFEPHPRRLFHPDLPPLRIVPFPEKVRRLRAFGIDYLRVIRFSREFAGLSAEAFMERVLKQELGVHHVVTGEDFAFGAGRKGNAALLAAQAPRHGFSASACKPVIIGSERCSSTRIRAHLALGEMEAAERLLGHPYQVTGRVQNGDKRGRTIGFPTANILPGPLFAPAFGVYAVRAEVAGEKRQGVANFGLRPTFGGQVPRWEVHLFDWEREIYGERFRFEPFAYLREEQKFEDVAALKMQIARDAISARRLTDA